MPRVRWVCCSWAMVWVRVTASSSRAVSSLTCWKKYSPASVSLTWAVSRSSRVTCSSSSNAQIWRLMAVWDTKQARAALVKLPERATR